MKKPDRRKIYWDTACWLAWLQDERFWPASVIAGLEDVVTAVEVGTVVLFTSITTRGEIFMGNLTQAQKEKWAKLMRRSNVQEVNSDARIFDRASAIREWHHNKGQRVELPDALHLATAIIYKADEFQTLDGLKKEGRKAKGLLVLSGDVQGYNLKIVHPYPIDRPSPELVTITGPLFGKAEDEPILSEAKSKPRPKAKPQLKPIEPETSN
jgi:predicted nucleic acid-binding protein